MQLERWTSPHGKRRVITSFGKNQVLVRPRGCSTSSLIALP